MVKRASALFTNYKIGSTKVDDKVSLAFKEIRDLDIKQIAAWTSTIEIIDSKLANIIDTSNAPSFNQALSNTENPDSLFNLALKGGEGKLGFTGVADQYSGTKAGNLANYYAGMSYLNIKDFKNAEKYLLEFSSKDMMLNALALGGLGDAYSETNKAAETNENDFTTPRFLFKAAQLALIANKKEEANKLFTQIKEKYETSKEGLNIDAYIAMTE